jgi:hypothetical protein
LPAREEIGARNGLRPPRRHPAEGHAPAEEPYFAAIVVAREQDARRFELRAALLLAKLN